MLSLILCGGGLVWAVMYVVLSSLGAGLVMPWGVGS